MCDAELLAYHKMNVERFTLEKKASVVSETLDDYASIDKHHGRQHFKDLDKKGAYLFLSLFFVVPWVVSWLALCFWGSDLGAWRQVAISFGFASTIYMLFITLILPRLIAEACKGDPGKES